MFVVSKVKKKQIDLKFLHVAFYKGVFSCTFYPEVLREREILSVL